MSTVSLQELRKMSLADLGKEISEQQGSIGQLFIQLEMGKEKNSSKLKVAKKQLARMFTVQSEKRREELQSTKDTTTVSAPSPAAKA